MNENDTFRLMDRDEAVAWGCLLVGLAAWAYAMPEPDVKPAPMPQRCAVTVAQYGPGERWNPRAARPACAGELAQAPNDILTLPLEKP